MKQRNILSILIIVTVFVTLHSCIFTVNDDSNCITGMGSKVSETINVEPFSSVINKTVVDVEIIQGDSQIVLIEGDQNMIDELDLEVSHGEVTIDLKGRCYRNFDLKVYITLPVIEAISIKSTGNFTLSRFDSLQSLYISVSSTGDLYSEGTLFIGELLEIESSSTGDIDLQVESDLVEVQMSGTGNVTLSGICNSQFVKLSSTGSYRAFDLISNDCEIINSGVGDAKVYVSDYLDVYISSVGDVYYMGDPTVSDNDKGPGDLVHVH